MRKLVVHFAGGTEVTLETDVDPTVVYDSLTGDDEWLVVEDTTGERHYLAIAQIAYLAFSKPKGVGFS